MKIKYRITLLFTIIVLAILAVLCSAIYYSSELTREKNFKNRLRNRALTVAKYLIEVTDKDQELMKKIEENTVFSLQRKCVIVYNYLNQPIYNQFDDPDDSIVVTKDMVDRARIDGEYFSKAGQRDVLSTQYIDRFNRYIIVVAAYDEEGIDTIARLKGILWFSFFGGILITLITGYYFSHRLVRPIITIIDEVKDISSHSLTKRIQAGEQQDELNQLAATFNQLLDRMQQSFEIQRRFISNASHEFSTPLTAISSQIEIALQNERSVPEYKDVLESVYSDVFQMGQLTKGLLEIAKTGSGGAIELNEVRIDEVLLRIAGDVKRIHPSYTVHLNFDEFPDSEEAFLVYGNTDLLYSAIRNIVANACKFSHTGEANVHLLINEKVTIKVQDEGIGIPPEEMAGIFQPFYRADNAKDKKGFGLGLALANRIIRLHKGKIMVESAPGKGTTFFIVLEKAF